MGLLGDIKQAQVGRRGPRCSVSVTLDAMSPEDADDLRAAMDDPGVMATTISAVLRDRGYAVRDDAIQRHRRGACACPGR